MESPSRRCRPGDHQHEHAAEARLPADAYERAASIFRALGDTPRLRMLHLLSHGELCVSAIVAELKEKFSTVSQRLRLLRAEGLVVRRREGTHLYYSLADKHVADLLANALEHACERSDSTPPLPGDH
jgi:DNA-binding transcriptional ArsR family regulator